MTFERFQKKIISSDAGVDFPINWRVGFYIVHILRLVNPKLADKLTENQLSPEFNDNRINKEMWNFLKNNW